MNKSKIDWCDMTWNPVTGCMNSCEYCYARAIVQRFSGYWDEGQSRTFGAKGEIHELQAPMFRHTSGKNRSVPVHSVQAPYPFGFEPTYHRYRLWEPAEKPHSRNIFVCSMADLFGDWVPDPWIQEVFAACEAAPQHNYLFLTKYPERYIDLFNKRILPDKPNYYYGSTCTDSGKSRFVRPRNDFAAYSTFLSIEPLLKPWDFNPYGDFDSVQWVIIGAMTGPCSQQRQPQREWVEAIVEQCRRAGTPVFMKDNLASVWEAPLIREYPEQLINYCEKQQGGK